MTEPPPMTPLDMTLTVLVCMVLCAAILHEGSQYSEQVRGLTMFALAAALIVEFIRLMAGVWA